MTNVVVVTILCGCMLFILPSIGQGKDTKEPAKRASLVIEPLSGSEEALDSEWKPWQAKATESSLATARSKVYAAYTAHKKYYDTANLKKDNWKTQGGMLVPWWYTEKWTWDAKKK